MSATCIRWYMLRGNTGLSRHGDPVFPHFCPLNQNLVRVMTWGGGGYQMVSKKTLRSKADAEM